jgi:hypothetical protein
LLVREFFEGLVLGISGTIPKDIRTTVGQSHLIVPSLFKSPARMSEPAPDQINSGTNSGPPGVAGLCFARPFPARIHESEIGSIQPSCHRTARLSVQEVKSN